MNTLQPLDERLREARSTAEYSLERLLLDINEQLCQLMQNRGITRSELADRLHVSKPWITKLLKGNRNLTLRSLVAVAHELGLRVDMRFAPKQASYDEEWPAHARVAGGTMASGLKEPYASEIREAPEYARAA